MPESESSEMGEPGSPQLDALSQIFDSEIQVLSHPAPGAEVDRGQTDVVKELMGDLMPQVEGYIMPRQEEYGTEVDREKAEAFLTWAIPTFEIKGPQDLLKTIMQLEASTQARYGPQPVLTRLWRASQESIISVAKRNLRGG